MIVTIAVDQIKTWSHIGVFKEEKKVGRHFAVDVSLQIELNEDELLTDQLKATYNYAQAINIVEKNMQIPGALLEKKAIEIGREIKASDLRIQQVKIRISKLKPPVQIETGPATVEILI